MATSPSCAAETGACAKDMAEAEFERRIAMREAGAKEVYKATDRKNTKKLDNRLYYQFCQYSRNVLKCPVEIEDMLENAKNEAEPLKNRAFVARLDSCLHSYMFDLHKDMDLSTPKDDEGSSTPGDAVLPVFAPEKMLMVNSIKTYANVSHIFQFQ